MNGAIQVRFSQLELQALSLLLRHAPAWFGADSDGMGTHEGAAKRALRRVLRQSGYPCTCPHQDLSEQDHSSSCAWMRELKDVA